MPFHTPNKEQTMHTTSELHLVLLPISDLKTRLFTIAINFDS